MHEIKHWPFAAIVVTAAILAGGAASASDDDFFHSPTGNIGCAYAPDLGYLRCDVRDGVKPLPPMPKSCEFDWGQGFWLHKHGAATIVCAGDTAFGAGKVLPYGMTWKRGVFTCGSSTSGFRCTNADRHGFFISRGNAYRF
ncbi:MAG: DUF6636 domain-containing protein [Candidatus Baltobacteraceae bacterium]